MFDEKIVYNVGDRLSVTIAPDDKVQQFLKVNRLSEFYDYYKAKFEKLDSKNFNHWFRIELSEPIGEIQSEGPRLHLHGYVELKTRLGVFNWLLTIMPDLLQHARLEIHHLDDTKLDGWINYCIKQAKIMPSNCWLSNFSGSPLGEAIRPQPCRVASSPPHSPLEGTGGREGV